MSPLSDSYVSQGLEGLSQKINAEISNGARSIKTRVAMATAIAENCFAGKYSLLATF